MKHVFILYHHKKSSHPFIPVIHQVMKGMDYDICISEYIDHASEIVERYEEPTRFYSVGGDGMVNQVMQKIVGTEHQLVVLPYGSGNDFTRIIYKKRNPRKILERSLYKKGKLVDVLKINDRYAMNSICFGIDASIANAVHDESQFKFVPSRYTYAIGILQRIRSYNFPNAKIVVKNDVVYDGPISVCAMMNGRCYGGGFYVTPQAEIDDGMMDFTVLPKIKKKTFPKYVALILKKKLSSHPDVLTMKVKEMKVYTEVSANIDGDEMHADEYHIKVVPAALYLVF
ncbi:MAG: hypothetical protein J6P61_01365 [Erysipelotrichaceae bacterium]|nr:hypothetical protein [Erysipelotrichaceae bacterium]